METKLAVAAGNANHIQGDQQNIDIKIPVLKPVSAKGANLGIFTFGQQMDRLQFRTVRLFFDIRTNADLNRTFSLLFVHF